MSKLRKVKFEDTKIQFIDGDRGINYPKKDELKINGDCIFLNTSNVLKENFDFSHLEYITKEKDEILRNGKLQYQDIVLTTRGTLGNVAIYEETILFEHVRINSGMLILRVNSDEIDTYYLYLYLRSIYFKKQVQNISSGSAQPQLPVSALKNAELILPIRKTQEKIVKIMRAIDNKIDINNKINSELESIAKTLYDYWFVQFDFPNEEGKPYKSSGGAMEWNEELKREIPVGWEVRELHTILAKESLPSKLTTSDYLNNGKIPIIDQSTDFIAGFTDMEDTLIKCNVPRIVFGDHTRIVKFINFDFARGADGTQILLSKEKRMPQHLFYHSILKIDLSNYGYARHFKFLKESKIIIPSEEVALKYEKMVKTYFDKIRQNIFENQELASLRDWLLPMLMNGQVSVE